MTFSLFRDSTLLIGGKWGVLSELDFVLVLNADHERSNINKILVNGNLLAVDSDSGLMDGFSDLVLKDEGLKSSL